MKNEHPDRYDIDFGNVYTMHCPEVYGGCGMEISGNSKEEAIEKWNRRMAKSDIVEVTGKLGDICTFRSAKFRRGDLLFVQTVEKS